MQSKTPIPPTVLTLPGWQGSGPEHWQSRWESLYGYTRVEQHDWQRPLRGDWSARLEEVVLQSPEPIILVAHSLACILTAWWAAHSRHVGRVAGALLVAPADVEREDLQQAFPRWTPIVRRRLPFRSVVVASSDDPYCSLESASRMAAEWGASCYQVGAQGHLNTASGLGDWEEGHALLSDLCQQALRPLP